LIHYINRFLLIFTNGIIFADIFSVVFDYHITQVLLD
jgi:hypothetical protein